MFHFVAIHHSFDILVVFCNVLFFVKRTCYRSRMHDCAHRDIVVRVMGIGPLDSTLVLPIVLVNLDRVGFLLLKFCISILQEKEKLYRFWIIKGNCFFFPCLLLLLFLFCTEVGWSVQLIGWNSFLHVLLLRYLTDVTFNLQTSKSYIFQDGSCTAPVISEWEAVILCLCLSFHIIFLYLLSEDYSFSLWRILCIFKVVDWSPLMSKWFWGMSFG